MDTIEFGGQAVAVHSLPNGDKVFSYNGQKVLLSAIIEYINSPFPIGNLTDEVTISKRGEKITIGCLEDSQEKFLSLQEKYIHS